MSTAPVDLDAIEARAGAATPGFWRWNHAGSDAPELQSVTGHGDCPVETDVLAASHHGECGDCRLTVDIRTCDADFIAAARTDVPALVAEVERLRDIVQRVEGVRESMISFTEVQQ